MKKPFDVYLCGVGGQGIGLLSETILRAADHAGLPVKGVDTHGLAQRGGGVVSRIRIGKGAHSPLIAARQAHMVIALERHEAIRGMNIALRDNGTLVYYDAVWQPLDVRLGRIPQTTGSDIREHGEKRDIRVVRVFRADLDDSRMLNMVLLACLDRMHLVPDLKTEHYRQAMEDLMTGSMLATNRALFEAVRTDETFAGHGPAAM